MKIKFSKDRVSLEQRIRKRYHRQLLKRKIREVSDDIHCHFARNNHKQSTYLYKLEDGDEARSIAIRMLSRYFHPRISTINYHSETKSIAVTFYYPK